MVKANSGVSKICFAYYKAALPIEFQTSKHNG
jgi:hypothetical protein